MKNFLKINYADKKIVMDRTFAKLAENTRSEEYTHLQQVRGDYPDYAVVVRTIKNNPAKETYKGLTYEYMENYILSHEKDEGLVLTLTEFNELRTISRCHKQGLRYPTIKKWFLNRYPEIEDFPIAS